MKKNLDTLSRIFSGGLLSQVTILALLTTTIILSFFGWQRIDVQTRNLTRSLHRTLELNSHWLATTLVQPVYNIDNETISAICNSLLTFPDIVEIKVNANEERMIFADKEKVSQLSSADTILVKKEILYDGSTIGEVEVLASQRSLKEQIKESTWAAIFQIIILDIFLVAALIFALSRKVITPVDQLKVAAHRIASGNLEHNIDINSNNELGLLAENLETMRKTIQTKIVDLETEITSRRMAENELKIAKNYIDNIINSMPSLLVGVDNNQKIIQWNKQAEIESGIPFDDAKGKDFIEVLPQYSEEQENIRKAITNKEVWYENEYKIEEGEKPRYKDITVFPLVRNGVEGAVIRIDDVTEQYELHKELGHSRKLDAIGQLAGGVAHDFNNMLGGILGGAELLALHVKNDGKAKKYIDMIIKSGRRAGDLTNKLLSFARKGNIESTPIEVAKAVKEAASILEHSLDKRISIEISTEPENTYVVGDLSQLQNAFLNLGLNAGHAMPDGGNLFYNVRQIELDREYCSASPFDIEPGQYFDIEVRDTGTGISADYISQIFEPFFTTKAPGKGSGLGLSAVYGTIRQHGGAITVYSELGRGTTFHIFLPLAEQQEVPNELKAEAAIKGNGKIMVIDDEQVIRATAKAILENMGYEVVLADDGLFGLEIFKKEHDSIDLVIMDMIMPNMNGHDCFLAMKAIAPDAKVILASGFSQETEFEELKSEGLLGFLKKPYTTAELSRVIADAERE